MEPRHIAEYSIADDTPPAGAQHHPIDGPNQRQLSFLELDVRSSRRGPRLGPSYEEQVLVADPDSRAEFLEEIQDGMERVVGNLQRADTEEWDWYTGVCKGCGLYQQSIMSSLPQTDAAGVLVDIVWNQSTP